MMRLRVFFAIILFLFFLPLWRFLDYQAIFIASTALFTLSIATIIILFILLPLRLISPQVQKRYHIAIFLILCGLSWLGSPLSDKATRHHELRHCGLATFTGLFYPVSAILPPAHQDDLEVRNQMCWIRKMVKRSPEEIDDVKELQNYLELVRQKLLNPSRKYKASLPLIALLHGSMSASLSGSALESVEIGKMFFDSLHFWKSQYSVEISEIEYPWYAWPYSSLIQFEYGIIEKNWESILQNIQFESN